MRPSDYPPPSYAGHIWWAQRRIWLATGRGQRCFEDTPTGLAELRIALLELADQRATLSAASERAPSVRLDASGRRKITEGDLWETTQTTQEKETGNA